jgi:hypothetical protein
MQTLMGHFGVLFSTAHDGSISVQQQGVSTQLANEVAEKVGKAKQQQHRQPTGSESPSSECQSVAVEELHSFKQDAAAEHTEQQVQEEEEPHEDAAHEDAAAEHTEQQQVQEEEEPHEDADEQMQDAAAADTGVEEIRDSKLELLHGQRTRTYLVKWQGQPSPEPGESSSWHTAARLEQWQPALDAYRQAERQQRQQLLASGQYDIINHRECGQADGSGVGIVLNKIHANSALARKDIGCLECGVTMTGDALSAYLMLIRAELQYVVEGLSETQRLCSVHVAQFNATLDAISKQAQNNRSMPFKLAGRGTLSSPYLPSQFNIYRADPNVPA